MNRDDGGQFTATVEDEDVVAAIAQLTQPALTTDVADELDFTRQAADYRLRRLREADWVSSSRVGGSLIWDTVGQEKASAESAQMPGSDDTQTRGGRSDPPEPREDDVETTEPKPDDSEPVVDEVITDIRDYLEDRSPHTEHDKTGIMVVVREFRIRSSSTTKTAEFKTAVYDAIYEHYGSKKPPGKASLGTTA